MNRLSRKCLFSSVLIFLLLPSALPSAHAETLCIKNRAKVSGSSVRTRRLVRAFDTDCPGRFSEILEVPSPYGNGSAGALTVSSNTTFSDTNLQYTDITINTGITLTIASGQVLRCTGTFTNNGIIVVQNYAAGGGMRPVNTGNTLHAANNPAAPGVAGGASGSGEAGGNASAVVGGFGDIGMSESEARSILLPGPNGGGGGAGGGTNSSGGYGGGTLVVLCKGAITNTGTIRANGLNANFGGSGGGAGGVVVLASKTSIDNSGSVVANGGDGSDSASDSGAGGGGGGGIIHFLAPGITAGTRSVAAGAAGSNATDATDDPRGAGGAGGACGGAGGAGSSVLASDSVLAADDGADGHALSTEVDPTALF